MTMLPNKQYVNTLISRGFTLIEVLIVMFIISIVITVITLNVSVFSTARFQLDKAIQTLSYQIQWAQEKSLMTQSTYRVLFQSQGYRFDRYDQTSNQWKTLEQPKTMTSQPQSTWFLAAYGDNDEPLSQIIFSPNHDLQAFRIVLTTQDERRALYHSSQGQLEIVNEVP